MYDRDIHISASNLRDYWACNKRYQYRITSAKSSVATIYMTYGLIVHEGIERMEKFSKPLESILEWSLHEWEKANTVKVGFLGGDIPKPPRSFKNMYKSYVEKMKPKFAEGNAIVEKMFKLPYDKSRRIYITGKMDRIDDFGVYDWKTGARPPSENDLNDIQFYLYRWAHEKLYDKFPDSVLHHRRLANVAHESYVSYLYGQSLALLTHIEEHKGDWVNIGLILIRLGM